MIESGSAEGGVSRGRRGRARVQAPPGKATQAEFARLLGVSAMAVSKAVSSGRIRKDADGFIEVETAMRDWVLNARSKPAALESIVDRLCAGGDAIALADEVSGDGDGSDAAVDEGADGDRVVGASGLTLADLQRLSLALKTERQRLELRARRGELVERAQVERVMFQFARRFRDAWLVWPARAAAVLSARLGVEVHSLENALVEEVRRYVEELSRDPLPSVE